MKLKALPAFILTGLISHALAGPLKEAKINQIVNDVKVVEPKRGAHSATLQESIKDDLGVATGVQSRAELLFQDNTLTRLGAETFFTFHPGTRDLDLDRGSILLQVPKNLGGARIRAASVTASITGTTIMIEHLPGSSVKIAVLEGSLTVGVDRRPGEGVVLRAGKMVILGPQAKELPKPVDVNLRKLVLTSPLINPDLFAGKSKGRIAALPSMDLIEKEIALQKTETPSSGAAVASFDTATMAGGVTQIETKVAVTEPNPATDNARAEAFPPESTRTAAPANPIATTSGADRAVATVATDRLSNVSDTVTTAIDGVKTAADPTAQASVTTTTPPVVTTTPPIITTTPPVITTTPPVVTTTPPIITTTPPVVTTTPPVITTTPPVVTTTPTTAPAFIATPNPYTVTTGTGVTTPGYKIVTNGIVDTGGLYQSAAANGSASTFLFDTTSAFDTSNSFDSKFSVMSGGSAPSKGVAVYRFAGLDIRNTPTFNTTGGATDIALVSQSAITSRSSGSAWKVDSLRSLFFGSVNGPIAISQGIETNSLSVAFKYLQVYARGTTGAVTLDGKISLALSNLYVDAEQGITVSGNAAITAFSTIFNTPGTIVMNTSPVSAMLKLNSGTGIKLAKPLFNANVEMTAPMLQAAGDLSVLSGVLNVGAGGVQAGGSTLSGFDRIDVRGNVEAGSVYVKGALNIGGTFTTKASSGAASLSADTITIGGGVDLTAAAVGNGGALTVSATDVNVASTGIKGIKADGADGLLALVGGGNGGAVNVGTSIRPITNSISINEPISASTGANGTGVLTGGNGGNVNLVAKGTIGVNSTVKVSDSALRRASRNGGNIKIDSRKATGTAIAVNNSGQLLALLNSASTGAGGTITFVSSGGDILVNGGTVQADRGAVDIRNNGAGNVSLTNASLRGDVVKVGALGANGQLLIGGGTISADTSLKLYGGSSNGQVRFTDDVTLGGASTKIIAGKAVTIDNGKTVTVGGTTAAKVFTDKANYTGSGGSGSTSGTFAGNGATTKPFAGRPAF